jgi:hypothetical protein
LINGERNGSGDVLARAETRQYAPHVPKIATVLVPKDLVGRRNLRVGIRQGVWGFSQECMERSTYLADFRVLAPGDLLLLAQNGPLRAGPGGWAGSKIGVGYIGAITKLDEHGHDRVWSNAVFPYRAYFNLLLRITDFSASVIEQRLVELGAAVQGTDVMEALRLSSTQQGRPAIV